MPTKYMNIEEFHKFGYLHEINRLLLHPLGLALEVIQNDDGTWSLGGVQDWRDDPEGVIFAEEPNQQKIENIINESNNRSFERFHHTGFWIQPPPNREAHIKLMSAFQTKLKLLRQLYEEGKISTKTEESYRTLPPE